MTDTQMQMLISAIGALASQGPPQPPTLMGDIRTGASKALPYDGETRALRIVIVNDLRDHGALDGLADDDHTQYLLADGTRGLSGDWDAGTHQIRAQTFYSDVGIGTAPLTVTSTTLVANLNADLLDGQQGSYYLDSANFTGTDWTDLTDAGETALHTHDVSAMSGILGVAHGGLGISTTPSNGMVPIGNGTNYTAATLTGSSSITVTSGAGSIALAVASDLVIASSVTVPNTGLHILDTNSSHDLVIKAGSDLTVDRILTFTTGDADRTVTLSGNPTLADWFDQSVKTTATPEFSKLFLGVGAAATPSLYFTGDTDTGLYHLAADWLGVAIGGVKKLEIDDAGNLGVGYTPNKIANQTSVTINGTTYSRIDMMVGGATTFYMYSGAANTGLGTPSTQYFNFDVNSATRFTIKDHGVYVNTIKSGATQVAAGANASELWKTSGHATLPNNVVMIGV